MEYIGYVGYALIGVGVLLIVLKRTKKKQEPSESE